MSVSNLESNSQMDVADLKSSFQMTVTITCCLKVLDISALAFPLLFHRFSPFNCCLSEVFWLDKEDYPENLLVAFCPDKQRSFQTVVVVLVVVVLWS